MTEREIFFEALEMGTPEARAAYLQGVCGRDVILRRKVDELLKEHFSNDSLLAGPALEGERASEAGPPASEAPAQMIGRYKLLERIGEGGFGEVWMAEQREPVKRRVALKIIKLGMDSRQIVARFEAERQALAMMDHPNIAKIFDAGTTESPLTPSLSPGGGEGVRRTGEGAADSQLSTANPQLSAGRPYFVMELVRGMKITEYCDQNQLPTRERLNLFILVCQAIQHAHQKGIIHRDIKPSNILVTLHDGVPVPKVIDFGIAKATAQELTDKTLFTQFQQFIGTPAYISPEQAEMSGLDIDTRADIYSLGVLLYELLVGQTPFDAKEMIKGGLDSLRQIIREKEPLRPSTKLSQTLAAAAESQRKSTQGLTVPTQDEVNADARRRLRLQEQIAVVRGDLDWIVMKCLEKDRTRRYDTASGLAMDIQRHLSCEPVQARPPSKLYEFQKTVRRHKFGFAAAAAIIFVLAVGITLTAWQAVRATRAEHEQSWLRQAAEEARANEATQRQHAEDEGLISLQNLYAADVSLAQTALEEGNLGRARKLLEGHWPKPGQTDLRGFEWHYFWNLCQGDQLHTLAGHSNIVACVAYSPDGKTLASGSEDDTVRLWNVGAKQVTATLPHGGRVLCLAFSPDGQILATGSTDGLIRFWDMATRTVQFTIRETAVRMAFSPAAPLLAIGRGKPGDDLGTVAMWDYAVRKEVNTLSNAGPNVAFSLDGKVLASGSCNRAIVLRDVASGRTIRTLPNAVRVLDLTFSPDGRTLASGNWTGDLQLWDVPTGRPMAELQRHPAHVHSVAFSPDGRTLATGNADDTILLWSVTSRKVLATLRGHGAPVKAVVFSPDGKRLASGSADQTIMLWNARPKEEPERIADILAPPVFSPDGLLMVGTCRDNQVRCWKTATGQAAFVLGDQRVAVAFSPDGKTLITISRDYSIQRWDVASQTIRATTRLSRDKEPVESATISRDGKILATLGNWAHEVVLWDTTTGEKISMLAGHKEAVRQVEFSPDSRTLASVSHDQTARIWDVTTHKELASLTGHKAVVRCLAFSPDGKVLATGSYDDTVKLWNVSPPKELASLTGHRGAVFGLAFSPDGKTLAAGSGDGNVKLWNIVTRREVATLSKRRASRLALFSPEGQALPAFKAVAFVVFCPDGKTLATVDSDGVVHLWSAPTQ